MTAALALLAGVVAAGWFLPSLLRRLDPIRVDPLVPLIGWLVSTVGVLAAAVAGIALLLLPGHGAGAGVLSAMQGCWVAVSHGTAPRVEEFAGLIGAILLLALAARFAVIIVRGTRPEGAAPATWWLDHDRPLAFSLANGPGVVVATEGLTRHLPALAVVAVLAHERAHLHGRHHLVIGLGGRPFPRAASGPAVPAGTRSGS